MTGRNDTCPCGSGKKYKKCCIDRIDNYIFKINLKHVMGFHCVVCLGGDDALYDLHNEIQDAYGWDDDHMFSFVMDNEFFRSKEEYSGDPMGDGSAGDKKLKDLNLKKGQIFGYLFDYGEHHEFEVTVLDILTSDEEKSKFKIGLVEKIGKRPKQYEFEDDDMDESEENQDVNP